MSDANASDSSIVEQLKKSLTKYGTELLKPCDSVEELLRTLDKLERLLSNTPQCHKKLVETSLQPSKEALIANKLIRHSELDVRVSVASCIGEIIRITAPDEPYGDGHMQEFFQIANSAFERLPRMYGRAYSKAVSIIQNMSHTDSSVIMLDLRLYATIDHMVHLFLDGIRGDHPYDVFSSMEKIIATIIQNNADNEEFSLVLVKILLNSLKKENEDMSPVSFQLAENTFKNCYADLKAYLPEAQRCLDVPIEDYAAVVASIFKDATQRETTDSEDTVENISSPGEAGLAIEADLCNVMEGNETQNSKNDENYDENQRMISHCSDDPDKLDESMHMQQEQKLEEMQIGRKRIRRPNSLKKAEEGYDPFWILVDWRSMKSLCKKSNNTIVYSAKRKISKDHSPKPAGECINASVPPKPSKVKKDSERNERVSANKAVESNNEGKIVVTEDQMRDTTVKNHSEKGKGPLTKIASVKKSRKKTIVSEDLKEDIVTSVSQSRPISSRAKALSVEKVSKQNPKGSMPHSRKRTARESVGEEMIGCRIKVWWPLDQKFYKGTIMAFDPLYNNHQVTYDDGDIKILDLTGECWELLRETISKQKQEIVVTKQEQEIDAAPSSSKAKFPLQNAVILSNSSSDFLSKFASWCSYGIKCQSVSELF